MKVGLLTPEDAAELYYALESYEGTLAEKVGPDGEAMLSDDPPTFTPEEAQQIAWSVESKRDAIAAGFYDDEDGEVDDPESDTAEWLEHMNSILELIGPKGKNLL